MFNKLNIWTKTTFQILETLSNEPTQQYHVREIARRSNVSPSSASNILKELNKSDILNKKVIGRQTFYSVNVSNPIIRQFKVFNNILDLTDVYNDLKDISEQIILFGSRAKGTGTQGSDVDLFIKTSSPKKVRSKLKDQNNISPIIVETSEFPKFKKENKALFENIKRGIDLLKRENEL